MHWKYIGSGFEWNEHDRDKYSKDADTKGKPIGLTPSADFGGNKARLTKFYKRFGFVPNKGKNKDYTISESMVRPAKLWYLCLS